MLVWEAGERHQEAKKEKNKPPKKPHTPKPQKNSISSDVSPAYAPYCAAVRFAAVLAC